MSEDDGDGDGGFLSPRLRSLLNTVFVVLGALLIGQALHLSVVTGEAPITAPGIVLQLLAGGGFVLIGYRLRTPIGALAPSSAPSESRTGGSDRDAEFDPELSPIGDREPGTEPPSDAAETAPRNGDRDDDATTNRSE